MKIRPLLLAFVLALSLLVPLTPAYAPAASAASQGIYRALLIGNNAYQQNPLKGCVNDAKAMCSALQASTHTVYARLELLTDQTEGGIARGITGIQDWGVKSQDVTLIYYSGHGYRNASTGETGIVGTDLYPYSFSKMERSLSLIPGTVVLIIDSCYSGGVIGKSVTPKSASKREVSAYNQAIMDVFKSSGAKAKALSGSKYHVITSASGAELSYESGGYGHFTTGITEAMGWNATAGKKITGLPGDANRDGALSLSEAYNHARGVVSDFRDGGDQNVQISPTGSALTLVSRSSSSAPTPAPVPTPQPDEDDTQTGVAGLPNLSTAILASGQTLRLKYTGSVSWKSSEEDVATVSSSGLVTARTQGKAVVTGTQGGKTVVKCNIGVLSRSKVVSKVTISRSSAKRVVGSSFTLKAKVSPSGAYRKNIKWYSDNKSVATVSKEGKVKPLKPGTAKIYAIASSGMVDVCEVQVTEALVTKVKQKSAKASVGVGKTLKMLAKALPEKASNRKLKWSSEDPSIAKIDASTGKVTGLRPGKVYITATATDGTGKSSRCLLTVKKK